MSVASLVLLLVVWLFQVVFANDGDNIYTIAMRKYLLSVNPLCCQGEKVETKFCNGKSLFTSKEIKVFLGALEADFVSPSSRAARNIARISVEENTCGLGASCIEYRNARLEFADLFNKKLAKLQHYSYGIANQYSLGAVCLGAVGGYSNESKVLITDSVITSIEEMCGVVATEIQKSGMELASTLNFTQEQEALVARFIKDHATEMSKETIGNNVKGSLTLKAGTDVAQTVLGYFENPLALYQIFLDYHSCLFFAGSGGSATCDELLSTPDTPVESQAVTVQDYDINNSGGFDVLGATLGSPEYLSMVEGYVPQASGGLSDSVIIAIATFSVIVVCALIGLTIGLALKRKHRMEAKSGGVIRQHN